MAYEIEHKFLLIPDFDMSLLDESNIIVKQTISQGYLSKQLNVRARITKEKDKKKFGTLTHKRGKGLVREEYECPIDLTVAKELIKDALIVVNKTRYKYQHKNHIWDIDYFHDKKIWVAEIELSDVDEKFDLLPNNVIVKNVTGIKEYTNKTMGRK